MLSVGMEGILDTLLFFLRRTFGKSTKYILPSLYVTVFAIQD